MDRYLEGKTALVTGSVQGIGLAVAKALAAGGARIGVHVVGFAGFATLEPVAAWLEDNYGEDA